MNEVESVLAISIIKHMIIDYKENTIEVMNMPKYNEIIHLFSFTIYQHSFFIPFTIRINDFSPCLPMPHLVMLKTTFSPFSPSFPIPKSNQSLL